ncbi:MAG: ATP-binding protein, partial [Eubacteriales bacterium]|nr:ATP-binding protein [Eubacteriales bacterium]
MISKIFSAVLHGIEAELVTIETSISGGLPVTDIIGLADKTVNEAARRTRSAIISSGLNYPMGRVTVNIAPAGKRKRGSQLDLPMAIGVLASAGGIFMDELDGYCLAGELSLDGGVKKVTGLLPMLLEAKKKHLKMIIPYGNISEVMLIHGIDIYPVSSLVEVVGFFNKKVKLKRLEPVSMIDLKIPDGTRGRKLDYSDIRGMKAAKRALTIAAAGGHGVLMVGSPATGKTMLAERMPTIMPPMKYDEIIENTIIYSAAGLLTDDMPYVAERPFRNPHSSVTRAALIGGGLYPKPGEITLANRG